MHARTIIISANTSKGVTDVVRRVRSLWETDFWADF